MEIKDEVEEFEKILNGPYSDLKGKNIRLDERFTQSGFSKFFFRMFDCPSVEKHGSAYDIGYLPNSFRNYDGKFYSSSFRGFLAHELSHVALGHLEKDHKEPMIKLKEVLKNVCLLVFSIINPFYIPNQSEEIATDNDVIRRGLGEDLLAGKKLFNRFASQHGYSARKLEKILNRQELSPEKLKWQAHKNQDMK